MAMARRSNAREASAAIPTRFTKTELARIERVRSRLGLPSRSSFIREAVLERLDGIEKTKIVELRDVTVGEAERLIERYMKRRPGTRYVSDIADELGIELRVAFEAAQRLLDRGRLRVRGE
ncbi:MAG TPA: hypothetical protein VI915_06685 [Thermoplasmata archaeon]|nr:hypothetical protein [Thermoplasmata archaeon]